MLFLAVGKRIYRLRRIKAIDKEKLNRIVYVYDGTYVEIFPFCKTASRQEIFYESIAVYSLYAKIKYKEVPKSVCVITSMERKKQNIFYTHDGFCFVGREKCKQYLSNNAVLPNGVELALYDVLSSPTVRVLFTHDVSLVNDFTMRALISQPGKSYPRAVAVCDGEGRFKMCPSGYEIISAAAIHSISAFGYEKMGVYSCLGTKIRIEPNTDFLDIYLLPRCLQ